MKEIYIALLLSVLVMTGFVQETAAQNNAVDPVLEDVMRSYTNWNSAEFSGKLRQERLPLSPGIKMYMVRDSLIQISVRVPLMGEIGRVEISNNRIMLVNKMRKKYCCESTANLLRTYPGFITDLQSILLARVVLLGQGELNHQNYGMFTVSKADGGNFLLIPDTEPGALPFDYGYLIGQNSRTLALIANIANKASLEVRYSYPNRGEQIDFKIERKDKKEKEMTATLDFETVRWGGTQMTAVKTDGYERVTLKEFIASLK